MVSDAMDAYPEKVREDWVMDWPGQTVLCVSTTYWTSEVHMALQAVPPRLTEYRIQCSTQIEKVVKLVRGKLPTQTRITLGYI